MIDAVVSPAQWRERRDELILVGVRSVRGRPVNDSGTWIDLDVWLSGPPSPQQGRHPLLDPEVFAEGMAAAGGGDTDTVVGHVTGGPQLRAAVLGDPLASL